MQKTIDETIKTSIRLFLEEKYTSVVIEDGGRYCDYFANGEEEWIFCDRISVFLDCDGELIVEADCWEHTNNVPTENAIKRLLTA